MHSHNRLWWHYCAAKYWDYFNGKVNVLECGSYNVNGTVREHFPRAVNYVGVDKGRGDGVDVQSLIHEFETDMRFDVVISASMLEHDMHWKKSLLRMWELMSPNGIMALGWGSALCVPHADVLVPAGRVLDHLSALPMHIHEFCYEKRFGGSNKFSVLIAFKKMRRALRYPPYYEMLEDADK
jgi:hypothetical protein